MNPANQSQLLQLLERVESLAPKTDPKLQNYLAELRKKLIQTEADQEEQDKMLAAYEDAYNKLTAPANRLGVLLKLLDNGTCVVAQGDTEYVVTIDPMVKAEELEPGVRVRLNEGYAVVGVMDENGVGSLIKVGEVLEDGRIRVGGDGPGAQGRLVMRADKLKDVAIKTGDEVRTDSAGRIAIEHFAKQDARDYFIEEIPETPWSKIGGQDGAIQMIRETIEQPMLYPELYKQFEKKPVKGILLFGPPGCGKTMLGKAIAYNLAKDYSERVGHEVKECFLHISGPKILNMWLGETERMVREIFATAREKAKEGRLVVIFIDEAESILRTRSGGRYLNISNTVVPQFCAEMDGMVELENVVLVITSNRPDYIDPAILRPERIDRKVKIVRPNKEAAREILTIYLNENLPIDPAEVKKHDGEVSCARVGLIEGTLAHLWRRAKETEFLRVSHRNGQTDTLHWGDLVSGALLKSVVDRGKDEAIRRAIKDPKGGHGLRLSDLQRSLEDEFRENEIFPKSDVLDDWLKLIDVEPDTVVAVKPIRPDKGLSIQRKSVI